MNKSQAIDKVTDYIVSHILTDIERTAYRYVIREGLTLSKTAALMHSTTSNVGYAVKRANTKIKKWSPALIDLIFSTNS